MSKGKLNEQKSEVTLRPIMSKPRPSIFAFIFLSVSPNMVPYLAYWDKVFVVACPGVLQGYSHSPQKKNIIFHDSDISFDIASSSHANNVIISRCPISRSSSSIPAIPQGCTLQHSNLIGTSRLVQAFAGWWHRNDHHREASLPTHKSQAKKRSLAWLHMLLKMDHFCTVSYIN